MKKQRVKKQTQTGVKPWIITTLSILFVVLVGTFAWLQLHTYEQGVLDIYANQQDGYVQLVLEQIQLAEKRGGTEEQIEEILATLDASTNRYWTLSRQSSLIFVKDVMETNRYQGFTTATYYQTESAHDFIQQLQTDQVTHSTIQINSAPYIASGVMFRFQNSAYRVCLLTNANTVLDHNAYLTAKVNLCTLALCALAIFVVSLELLSYSASKYRKKYFETAAHNEALLRKTEQLNDALNKNDLYDARRTAYTARALPMLWEKLEGKEPWPLTFLILRCQDEEQQKQFLQFTQLQMNAKILRAFLDERHILLVLIRVEPLELSAIKDTVSLPGILPVGELTLNEAPEGSIRQCFENLWERTRENEEQAAMQV